ncbi:MAG: hypothetical protein CMI54_03510 [Parcubacteria group bacterium]|jgi:hypothetical protein|nr:hypothetical protein [Parcubacteria group bacterium]|tara:strand:- start:4603 stop:4890 length:288 start_codon:yes stop_codon:yes gene_type:complete
MPSKEAMLRYKNCRRIVSLLEGREESMPNVLKNYIDETRSYIMAYDLGRVDSLWDFYKKPEEIAAEWRGLTEEQWKLKMRTTNHGTTGEADLSPN